LSSMVISQVSVAVGLMTKLLPPYAMRKRSRAAVSVNVQGY
jgi:hypothetical protein